jgi:hypothetical protein
LRATWPAWSTAYTSPFWLPIQHSSSSMKMPSAAVPVSKRHRTGARVVPRVAAVLVVRALADRTLGALAHDGGSA